MSSSSMFGWKTTYMVTKALENVISAPLRIHAAQLKFEEKLRCYVADYLLKGGVQLFPHV